MNFQETTGAPFRFWVTAEGTYMGASDAEPLGPIEVPSAPDVWDQVWLFPGWGESPSQAAARELTWQTADLAVIANQILAIEEAEAAAEEGEDPPVDLLQGTRNQWLSYRTKVRNWKDGAEHYPDSSHRPTRPA